MRRNISTVRTPTGNPQLKGKKSTVVMKLGRVADTKTREIGIINLIGGGPLMKVMTLGEAKEARETGKTILTSSIKARGNGTREGNPVAGTMLLIIEFSQVIFI